MGCSEVLSRSVLQVVGREARRAVGVVPESHSPNIPIQHLLPQQELQGSPKLRIMPLLQAMGLISVLRNALIDRRASLNSNPT